MRAGNMDSKARSVEIKHQRNVDKLNTQYLTMPCFFDFIEGANLQRPTYQQIGSTHTAGYAATNPPPPCQMPSHFVIDPQLLQKMQRSLRVYLTTKCNPRQVSNPLVARLGITQHSLVLLVGNLPNLMNEATASAFFLENVKPLVSEFVLEVDHTPVQMQEHQQNVKPLDIA